MVGANQPTLIERVPYAGSQSALGGDAVSLVHSGRDWPDTLLRQLNHLVDKRLADPEPHESMRAVVFSGHFGDDLVTRTEALIVARQARQLMFSSGDTVTCNDVSSVHLR
ncbi:hypothetical protein ACTOB_003707 [Actinoplanes oblitus]|uniref:Uncharacterized protein n=1 Tax=Actinoplanes oblitus TaxID=3040509 RepID=A0ABY8WQ60_9ACTN|nr:hypothetical protein [Actinoplanes oblitus]WIN00032.1 hypothetical protein ACTOB_003707 [Actinoplanes oblitus]